MSPTANANAARTPQRPIAYGERRSVPAGGVIIHQGQPVEELYLILDGMFSVTDELGGGHELARLGSGEIVGEMSFVDANPPSATVTAVESSYVLAVPRHLLQQRLDRDANFAARFYRALAVFLSDRLRATVSRLGYGGDDQSLHDGLVEDDELDPNVLDTVHLAGTRFKYIVDRLNRPRSS